MSNRSLTSKTDEAANGLLVGVSDRPSGAFDRDLYGLTDDKRQHYVTELPTDSEVLAGEQGEGIGSSYAVKARILKQGTAAAAKESLLEELESGADPDGDADPFEPYQKDRTILDREDDYRRKRLNRMLSPERADPFGDTTPAADARSYTEVIADVQVEKEKQDLIRELRQQKQDATLAAGDADSRASKKRRARWDQDTGTGGATDSAQGWDTTDNRNKDMTRWDTPSIAGAGFGDETPIPGDGKRNKWDTAPASKHTLGDTPSGRWGDTPSMHKGDGAASISGDVTPLMQTPVAGKTSRWDMGGAATPLAAGGLTGLTAFTPGATPGRTGLGATPMGMTAVVMPTPLTPSASELLGPDQIMKMRIESEIEERNRMFTDEELDSMLPQQGYEILKAPADYITFRASEKGLGAKVPSQAVGATPTPLIASTPMYTMPTPLTAASSTNRAADFPTLIPELQDIQMKPEDYQFFSILFASTGEADADLSPSQIVERKIATLLLKIKNGTPPMRRSALKYITEKARDFGPGPLFNQILPLMMQSTLEDHERHLLVKVIDRVLYKLDELVRPYVHKILVVIEPLLIDEDYYARVEGREVISNLSKAAGLAAMIATMRPDIEHADEYVRNTTARAFAVVASALGIPSLILFLKAVCQSKKSWQARHTGIKIIQQVAILMGCAVTPHLKQFVEIMAHGLQDEQQKVRTITALALAALAEASAPYGIEAFDSVLRPLWKGITEHRGKGLAAFLKAIGLIIPLMDKDHANYYTREVMIILIREFSTPDEEMKKIVLKVVKQCVATYGVEADYIRNDMLLHYFPNLWVARNALDKRNYRQLVETTVEIANKVGGAVVVKYIVDDLKDPSSPFRKMTTETIEQICLNLGVADIDSNLEESLIDGLIYSFQEMAVDDSFVVLNGFASVVNCLSARCRPYLPQITGVIRWRLGTPSARSRQQAADLVARIAVVIKKCDETDMLRHLGVYLYEYLGEEYPEVLGSLLGALKAIVNVMGMENMMPPIKDLLPRLTPILKNRHEKVQENVIDLVGRIADRGGELVSPKEWDRICFDLLELLKAHKKSIRRATVNTFGYIARTIGPHDVIATLLRNLKVQERQLRICTTIAIAIVAETCLPYTVIPALMNEYRVADLNVQNGVLKTFSFMFEYIGELGRDYAYAIVPLFEDALMDRDLVHRQTATWATKHLALGVAGLGCEDALTHLMNFVWPNIFETSPHLVQAFFDAIDGFRVSLGPLIVLQYLLQGMFHPSRKVREVYWRLYNNVYIGHQDALVAFFPELPPVYPTQNFRRHELYITL